MITSLPLLQLKDLFVQLTIKDDLEDFNIPTSKPSTDYQIDIFLKQAILVYKLFT